MGKYKKYLSDFAETFTDVTAKNTYNSDLDKFHIISSQAFEIKPPN